MQALEQIIARNQSTQADIENGSFIVCDSERIPITGGVVEQQINELRSTQC